MEHEKTHSEIEKAKKDQAVMKEMMPYFIYMAIPIVLTIIIAMTFAPNMTLP